MSTHADTISVYYDGSCPSCVKDRATYVRLAGARAAEIRWVDITGKDKQLLGEGVNPYRALRSLHIKDRKGNILSGMDAYALLMNRIVLLKPLAWLISLPLVKPVLNRAYGTMVGRRLRRCSDYK